MKLVQGNYEGASKFAEFDTPLDKMSEEQKNAILRNMLLLASPGTDASQSIFKALAWAEEIMKGGAK